MEGMRDLNAEDRDRQAAEILSMIGTEDGLRIATWFVNDLKWARAYQAMVAIDSPHLTESGHRKFFEIYAKIYELSEPLQTKAAKFVTAGYVDHFRQRLVLDSKLAEKMNMTLLPDVLKQLGLEPPAPDTPDTERTTP